LVQAQRHEDVLLTNRLQGFIVVTALLMAGVSQFREAKFIGIAALLCLSGLLLSAGAFVVLTRTARTLEWYLDALVRLDKALFPPNRQVFAGRRRSLGELETRAAIRKYPVNIILGAWIPLFVSILWLLIFAVLVWVHLL
jgi:hypothetical protein